MEYIRLHLQSPGLSLKAVLRPETLPQLIELIQRHRVPAQELPEREWPPARPPRPSGGPPPPRGGEKPRPPGRRPGWPVEGEPALPRWNARSLATRDRLAGVEAKDLLNQAMPKTFPEKLLVLGGWITAYLGRPAIRNKDLRQLFARLGLEAPANPNRDVRQMEEQGWILFLDQKEICLTDAGWQRVAEMLEGGEGTAVSA